MYVLGIESSAHTLSISIINDKKVLSNIIKTYVPEIGKGYIPSQLAIHHSSNFYNVLNSALEQAGISLNDISLIGFTRGPGIGSALKIGAIGAKYIAYKYNIPIVGVNHSYAHLFIAKYFSRFKDPIYVYVSGGNTQIISIDYKNKHLIIHGETLDIGVGNFFDSLARELKVQGGKGLSELAKKGTYVSYPYPLKGMNFTFSGLLSHSKKLLKKYPKENIAFSAMHVAFSMITEAAERALMLTNKKEVVATGGVAQNIDLQRMLTIMAKSHGAKFYTVENQYNRDNAAMIALLARELYANNIKTPLTTDQFYRVDKSPIV